MNNIYKIYAYAIAVLCRDRMYNRSIIFRSVEMMVEKSSREAVPACTIWTQFQRKQTFNKIFAM